MQEELNNISKDFIYSPLTEDNFESLRRMVGLCITMHNQNCYIAYGFMAYTSISIDIKDIYGSIEFKSLIDGTNVVPCLYEKDREDINNAKQ
jgi:hypothetical protein